VILFFLESAPALMSNRHFCSERSGFPLKEYQEQVGEGNITENGVFRAFNPCVGFVFVWGPVMLWCIYRAAARVFMVCSVVQVWREFVNYF